MAGQVIDAPQPQSSVANSLGGSLGYFQNLQAQLQQQQAQTQLTQVQAQTAAALAPLQQKLLQSTVDRQNSENYLLQQTTGSQISTAKSAADLAEQSVIKNTMANHMQAALDNVQLPLLGTQAQL